MRDVNVLIDYDNAKLSHERSYSDVETTLSIILNRISVALHAAIPDSQTLICRLYGGWIHLDGQHSAQHSWLIAGLSRHRGRHGPLRTRLSLANALIVRPDLVLKGTYRDGQQKMVDGLICSDMIHLATDHSSSLAIVSDDDDFIPSVVLSAELRSTRKPLHLLRRRIKAKYGVNDGVIQSCSVVISEY